MECFTFFNIFSLSKSWDIPLIVLNVSLLVFSFVHELPLVSGSFPRNVIISVSCVHNLVSSVGESEIQESF